MHFFSTTNIAFTVLGYPISYVELMGTAFGLVSVYYASRANIITWPTGIINEIFLFILFFQVQLYADMFLQVYFFVVTVYGWYRWGTKTVDNRVSTLSRRARLNWLAAIVSGVIVAGFVIKNLHVYLPSYFAIPAAYPFIDSFVMVASIIATYLLAKKTIENWWLWLAVDVVCVGLYFKKQVYFLSLEYFIFLIIASYGLYNWHKQLRHG